MLNDKKTPLISFLFHNNNFIFNFKEKSELFNELFSKKLFIVTKQKYYTFRLLPLTYKSLSSFQFTANDIKSIINKLDPNKAHGHDMINIRMNKLCGDSI